VNSAAWSRLAFLALAGVVLALYFEHSLFGTGPVSIAVQVLAALLMLWARLTFGLRSFHAGANPTGGGLVTSGPYALIRHPIYAAILLFVGAAVAAHPALLSAGIGLLATVAVGVRIAAEERLVVQRYPEYAAYAARTRRLIPGVF
jgi:protein-S-isoprenylcysteine O-methyltransferase Ste14